MFADVAALKKLGAWSFQTEVLHSWHILTHEIMYILYLPTTPSSIPLKTTCWGPTSFDCSGATAAEGDAISSEFEAPCGTRDTRPKGSV